MEPDFGLTGRQLCHLTWIVIMDTSTVVDLGRQALWITVLISAPLLGVALLVGLIIGVPKLAALAITLAVVGGWQLTTLVDYTRALFQRIPGLFT